MCLELKRKKYDDEDFVSLVYSVKELFILDPRSQRAGSYKIGAVIVNV